MPQQLHDPIVVLSVDVEICHASLFLHVSKQKLEICNVTHTWPCDEAPFNEISSQGVFPYVVTFNVLVNTLCKEGMVVEAERVIDMMIQRGILSLIRSHTIKYKFFMVDVRCSSI